MGVPLRGERGAGVFTEDCLSCIPSSSCTDPGTGEGGIPCSWNKIRIAHDSSSWSFSHNAISSFLASRISSSVFVHGIFFFLSLDNITDMVFSKDIGLVGEARGAGSRSKYSSSSSSSTEDLPRLRYDSIL